MSLPAGFTLLSDVFAGEADAWLTELVTTTRWESHMFRIFGREVPMPRRIAWFGDVSYAYSGVTHPPVPMTGVVATIRSRVRDVTGWDFNTVLVNLYRDGSDSMGWHADDDYAPRVTTAIASVSLGAARRFDLRERGGPGRAAIVLPHGSLLVMGEGTQARWQHGLPKVREETGVRVNLTFRDVWGGHSSASGTSR